MKRTLLCGTFALAVLIVHAESATAPPPASSSVSQHAAPAGIPPVPAAPAFDLTPRPNWKVEANWPDARFGYSVCAAGDVNGDGYADAIVGSPYYDPYQDEVFSYRVGRAYLYYGGSPHPSVWADWTSEGSTYYAMHGWSVAGAGDVNGDGYDDVIVGAPCDEVPWSGMSSTDAEGEASPVCYGRAYLYFGSPSGPSPGFDWAFAGPHWGAKLGSSVAGAGDVNGDGYDDIIVGAPGYSNTLDSQGAAYLFYGGPGGPPATPDWIVEGDQQYATLGGSVAGAGDVNNDGYDDVIVGAEGYDNGETNEGRAFVYYGGPSGPSTSPDWVAEPDVAGAAFGGCVAGAGDVNGDGCADVIVGASGQPGGGAAYVFLGNPAGLSSTPDWAAVGDQNGDLFGASVSAAGDVNGDGYDDVIVGAHRYDGGETDEGRVYVYHGSPIGLPSTPDWTAESNQAYSRFGFAVAGAGDVNGDGLSDLIIGATWYDNRQSDEGVAFFYYGAPDAVPVEVLSFEAVAVEGGVLLRWRTSAASDLDRFFVRRSLDRENGYATLNEDPLRGSGPDGRSYSYLDADVVPGTLYFYELEAVEAPGAQGVIFGPYPFVAEEAARGYWLGQNRPNPFSPGTGTAISFSVGRAGPVEIIIVDATGRLVRTIRHDATRRVNTARWDGRDEAGRAVGSGVYFYRLKAEGFTCQRKMVVVR